MSKLDPPPAISRRTRTVAIPVDLHDRLRIEALQQSIRQKRRISIQDIAERAVKHYLDQSSMSVPE
ncbi:MAG: hypothetical protein H0T53_03240 [Herpetosiphonaceae bacterium]|nr:hypothetical protein [Herpetosiphonaceae bacterium]